MADVLEVLPDGTEILRDFTPEERAFRQAIADERAMVEKIAAEKAAARAALLERLGITEDEAALLRDAL